MPVCKGNMSPSWFFFLVLWSITFCMSSLLFDWYSNALSVCLVLVVNLLRQHLMFLWVLPNHLAYKSKVNVQLLFFVPQSTLFLLMGTSFSVSCCCLVGRANDTYRRCSDSRKLQYRSDLNFTFVCQKMLLFLLLGVINAARRLNYEASKRQITLKSYNRTVQ